MIRKAFIAALLVVITGGALTLRLPRLGERPMHGDEAVHAVKFNDLWRTDQYRYDPHEYHGPTLYYFTLPIVWISGATDFGQTTSSTFRLVPVLFGAGLILLLWMLRDGWGSAEMLMAALLTAVSPIMVFYSRYYIQETLLVFFTAFVIAAGYRYANSCRLGWALAVGVGLGLMHATKETSIIAFGALSGALLVTVLWTRFSDDRISARRHVRMPAIAVVALSAIAVSILMFSVFFRHPECALDAWRAYPTYFERAGGGGLHDHPWYYYLSMLAFTHYAPGPAWSEGLILVLAAFGAITAFRGANGTNHPSVPLLRFVTAYTVLLAAAYSVIPYKTPWCMLGFVHGMILLGGVGSVALIRWFRATPTRAVVGLLLAVAIGSLGWQAHRGSFRFHADPRNPYVYAHPVNDVARLAEQIEQLAGSHPDGHNMVVKVIGPDYWPLPWYLRRFTRVGYWEEVPESPDAPVIVTAARLQPAVDDALQCDYSSSYYGLRPDVVLAVYVEEGLWEKYMQTRAFGRDP